MPQGLTTVYLGSPGEALAVSATLQARGIPAFLLDDNVRTYAPFDTAGVSVFDRQVAVPDALAARARAALDAGLAGPDEDDLERSAPAEARDTVPTELPADYFAVDAETTSRLERDVAAARRRLYWCAVIPIGFLFVPARWRDYEAAVGRLGRRPREHAWTRAIALLAPLFSLIWFGQAILFAARDLWSWLWR